MKIEVDKVADALYIRLDDNQIVESEEVLPGLVVDFDEKDQIVGIELLHVSKRTPSLDLGSLRVTSSE